MVEEPKMSVICCLQQIGLSQTKIWWSFENLKNKHAILQMKQLLIEKYNGGIISGNGYWSIGSCDLKPWDYCLWR